MAAIVKAASRKSPRRERDDHSPVDHLPFVSRPGKPKGESWPRVFWSVKPNGRYSDECLIGVAYGERFLRWCAENPDAVLGGALLGWIIEDMCRLRGGPTSGIEIGFLATVCRAAAGARHG